jgi:hypothetical protein
MDSPATFSLYLDFLLTILLETTLYFLIFGVVLAFITGTWLVLSPASLFRLNNCLDQWYSTRRSLRFLEIPRRQEQLFYRHHRIAGLLITLGALYIVYFLLFGYAADKIIGSMTYWMNRAMAEWLLDAAYWLLLCGNLVVIFLGITIFVRPSLLKKLEKLSNRWISTRLGYKFLDISQPSPDDFIHHHSTASGLAIIILSLYILLQLLVFWPQRFSF